MRNKNLYLIASAIFILSISFVIGVHTVTTSTGGSSYSVNETIQNTYNISVLNADTGQNANITQVNITIPSNFVFIAGTSGTNVTVSSFENTSTVLSWTNSTLYLINGSSTAYFWFNATSTPGSYNLTVTSVNITGSYSSNISVTVNDTTNPTASFGEPVEAYNTSSGEVNFSLKCSDNYNISAAQFWGNFTGSWTINQSNTSMINDTYWNISLTLAEGTYIWGTYCNDSTNNSAWTSTNRTLIVDLTGPTATSSCSTSNVNTGGLVTCTCSGTDALSGISSTTASGSQDTLSVGTHTYTCTVTDYAGNSALSTSTFTVSGGSTSSGGSSSSSQEQNKYWTRGTVYVKDIQFMESYTRELQSKQRLKIDLVSGEHYIGIISLTENTAIINVSSDPVQETFIVGDERKYELNGDNYYDLSLTLNSIENNKANITIRPLTELISTEDTSQESSESQGGSIFQGSQDLTWLWIVIVVVILVIAFFIIKNKMKNQKKKKHKKKSRK